MHLADDRTDWHNLVFPWLFQNPHVRLLIPLGSPGKMLDIRQMINVAFVPEFEKQLEAPDANIRDIFLSVRLFDLGIEQSYPVIALMFVKGWIAPADMLNKSILVPDIWDA